MNKFLCAIVAVIVPITVNAQFELPDMTVNDYRYDLVTYLSTYTPTEGSAYDQLRGRDDYIGYGGAKDEDPSITWTSDFETSARVMINITAMANKPPKGHIDPSTGNFVEDLSMLAKVVGWSSDHPWWATAIVGVTAGGIYMAIDNAKDDGEHEEPAPLWAYDSNGDPVSSFSVDGSNIKVEYEGELPRIIALKGSDISVKFLMAEEEEESDSGEESE